MTSFSLVAGLALAILLVQALVMIIAPRRAIDHLFRKYRRIGIRPGPAGRGTLALIRLGGLATAAVAAYIPIKLLSE